MELGEQVMPFDVLESLALALRQAVPEEFVPMALALVDEPIGDLRAVELRVDHELLLLVLLCVFLMLPPVRRPPSRVQEVGVV